MQFVLYPNTAIHMLRMIQNIKLGSQFYIFFEEGVEFLNVGNWNLFLTQPVHLIRLIDQIEHI